MRIARVTTANGRRYVEYSNEGWQILDGELGGNLTRTGALAASNVRFLAPCVPRVVVGMAHNGLPEGGRLPPQAFLKSARTVIGPNDPIMLDSRLGPVQVETELAIVIGRECRHLTRENALDSVFGFTIANDVTATAQTGVDDLLTQAKNGDGFTPLGPWIETELSDADALEMRVIVDGVSVATGSTSRLANLVIDQLVYVTRYLSLAAGDVILGGCPGSFATVEPGQHVRLEIDGLGSLENTVHSHDLSTSSREGTYHALQH